MDSEDDNILFLHIFTLMLAYRLTNLVYIGVIHRTYFSPVIKTTYLDTNAC